MADTGVTGYYTPPSNLVGITPKQLRYGAPGLAPEQQFGGIYEQLAGVLGIGAETPLESKAYALVGSPGQESEYIKRLFAPTSPNKPVETALAASKGITEQAYTERGRQLEAEKQPLTDRYNALVAELTRRETKETGAQATALSREYGKRGVPLSSGIYEQDLLGKTGDISQFYGGQRTTVGLEREDKLRELGNLIANLPTEKAKELNMIDQKIAELQVSGANQQLQLQLEMYRDAKDREYNNALLDLKRQEFELTKEPKAPEYKSVEFNKGLYNFNPQTGLAQLLTSGTGTQNTVPSPTKTTTPKPGYSFSDIAKINAAPPNWKPPGY